MSRPYSPEQLALIEENRDFNVECGLDWWDALYEDFKDVAQAFGFCVTNIYFSGFWSQGDGASFEHENASLYSVLCAAKTLEEKTYGDPDAMTGYVAAFRDIHYLVRDRFLSTMVSAEATDVIENTSWVTRVSGGTYSHSGMMAMTDMDGPESSDYADAMPDGFVKRANETRDEILPLLRRCADKLYAALEQEHDHLTEDDQVWDAMVANEYEGAHLMEPRHG